MRVGVERARLVLRLYEAEHVGLHLAVRLGLEQQLLVGSGGGVRATATRTPTTPPLPRAPYPYPLHPTLYFPDLLLVDAHVLERAPVRLHVALEARARAVGAVARVEQMVEAQAFAMVRVRVRDKG